MSFGADTLSSALRGLAPCMAGYPNSDSSANALEGSELIYSDPPYPRRTRTSRHRYRFDYEEEDHVEQLSCMRADVVQGGA